jgi:hypothetical protein
MKLKTILAALLGTTALVAAPAFADRGHGRGHDRGNHYGHYKHGWKHAQPRHFHGHAHARPVVVVPPPRVVYRTPAPVYYAPPVVHEPSFGAGAISIRLSLPL